MTPHHKFFFAIPFDAATRCLYERVCLSVRERHPTVTTEIGSEEVGPSPEYSTIASFKVQNRELTAQFVNRINEADIIVADLTHNNPNVHVELGMALLQNKNILRVTGRSLSELGFDIRNFEVYSYRTEEALTKTILGYYDTFLKIKKLPISADSGPLYYREPLPLQLRSSKNRAHIQPIGGAGLIMRDGAIRVEFDLGMTDTESDWFGVYFRVGAHPFYGSHLMYVRKNGLMEIALYPGGKILGVSDTGRSGLGRHQLVVEFENNRLYALLGDASLETNRLTHQVAGGVSLAAWNAFADITAAEIVCRDTVEWG